MDFGNVSLCSGHHYSFGNEKVFNTWGSFTTFNLVTSKEQGLRKSTTNSAESGTHAHGDLIGHCVRHRTPFLSQRLQYIFFFISVRSWSRVSYAVCNRS
jgi:hypothetical protein